MKLTKKQAVYAVVATFVCILAMIMTILEYEKVFVICSHPVYMFFLVLSAGLGILLIAQGIIEQSPFRFFLAAVLVVYAISYSLIDFANLPWWIVVIVAAVVLIAFATLSLLRAGNKTEGIALNKYPEYKNKGVV